MLLTVFDGYNTGRYARLFLRYATFYARREIFLHWKDALPPTIYTWRSVLNSVLPLYKITYLNRNCPQKFDKGLGGLDRHLGFHVGGGTSACSRHCTLIHICSWVSISLCFLAGFCMQYYLLWPPFVPPFPSFLPPLSPQDILSLPPPFFSSPSCNGYIHLYITMHQYQ